MKTSTRGPVLQIPTPALKLVAFDAPKTLLIPPLLALTAQRWMPQRRT